MLENFAVSITYQEIANGLGFLGLINGLAFGLVCRAFSPQKTGTRSFSYWIRAAVPVVLSFHLFLYPIQNGWVFSERRLVQQFTSDTVFARRLDVPGASRVVWGEPTQVQEWDITRSDFEGLNRWLAESKANFYVFPEATMLYGFQKKVSPQPWVFFMPGHSFRLEDIGHVDTVILESLKRNNVTVVVLEKTSSSLDHELLERMPKLRSWIRGEFEKAIEFGIYEVWKHRQASSSPAS
jgi:hypothetical protein